eukprot:CAMPEP_0116925802 /NCGR_PEP_ID=MMETSP0467-20121206/24339_1 /TAXON_ID=283647 /ORGANISM="Mesodinium pulex, Strain SPMC105" /LENGTH=64 /DNA_ID=CAMNT_0004604923 /DNA_START=8 /DNA_END=199 /DNA_ORIENTATION=-
MTTAWSPPWGHVAGCQHRASPTDASNRASFRDASAESWRRDGVFLRMGGEGGASAHHHFWTCGR